jgi:hypothetical protein
MGRLFVSCSLSNVGQRANAGSRGHTQVQGCVPHSDADEKVLLAISTLQEIYGSATFL